MPIPEELQGLVDDYRALKQEYEEIRDEKEAVKDYLLGIPNAVTAIDFLNTKMAEVGGSATIQQVLETHYESKIEELRERYDTLRGIYDYLVKEHGE